MSKAEDCTPPETNGKRISNSDLLRWMQYLDTKIERTKKDMRREVLLVVALALVGGQAAAAAAATAVTSAEQPTLVHLVVSLF